jgi:two-component system, cell cycle sensor histidine kinase and response regulator CckA
MVPQEIKTLLVEDNPGDALLFQEILAEITTVTFNLVHSERLSSALKHLQTDHFDVVLLDLLLPDSQGLDTFVQIYTQAAQTPIVVLTGLNDAALAIQAMQAGAQDYLVKGQVKDSDVLMRSIRYAIERKRIQVDLNRREQEFRTLADNAPDVIARFDRTFRHLYVNRAVEPVTGLEMADFLGKTNRDLNMPADQVKHWEDTLNQVFSTGAQTTFEFEFPSADGLRYYQSRCVPEFSLDGVVESVLAITRDVTEQKQLQAQVLRTQRLESLGTLASGIAHDLNNILTPILAITQLLPMQNPSLGEQSRRMLTMLEDNAKRAATLVKQILTFARGWDGERVPAKVEDLLVELAQIIQSTFPKSIRLVRHRSPKDLWLVSVDPNQLHQVLLNLCLNARDAMPQGGTLTISTQNIILDREFTQLHLDATIGSYVLITVADTGMGIETAIRDRIFEPFFTTKDFGKGTGLGLSTVLGIIKNYGGFVELQSEVGVGSEFQVYLPAVLTDSPTVQKRVERPKGKGQLILIVDDEPNILQITQATLESHNYRVLIATNGVDAIACYAQSATEIDLVLMDMMMPEMGGLTAIRTLQKINPQVKVIAVSGLDAQYLSETKAIGVTTFLAKPFTTSDLLQNLQQSLAQPKQVGD